MPVPLFPVVLKRKTKNMHSGEALDFRSTGVDFYLAGITVMVPFSALVFF